MKNYFLFLICIPLLFACGNNKADQPGSMDDTAASYYLWESALNDSTGRLSMKKVETADSTSAKSILGFTNNAYPRIRLELVKTSNDTIYLKIDDATFLTQQMGSSGSILYLAAVVYNLTELTGIKYVTLNFEEGDHARPGTYNRESFSNE